MQINVYAHVVAYLFVLLLIDSCVVYVYSSSIHPLAYVNLNTCIHSMYICTRECTFMQSLTICMYAPINICIYKYRIGRTCMNRYLYRSMYMCEYVIGICICLCL